MSKVKFCRGTSKDFKPMVKDPDTIYYITDTKQMFLGEDEYCTGEGDGKNTLAGSVSIDWDEGTIDLDLTTRQNIVALLDAMMVPCLINENTVYNASYVEIDSEMHLASVSFVGLKSISEGESIEIGWFSFEMNTQSYELTYSDVDRFELPMTDGVADKPYELTDNNYSSAYLFNSTFNVTNCANTGGTLVGANLNAFISRLYMWAAQQTQSYDMPVFKLHFDLWSTYHNDINATFIALNNIPLGSGWVLDPSIHLCTKWGEPVIERIVPGEEAGMDEIVVSYLTINDVATSVAPVVMNNNSEVELTGDIVFNPRYTGTAN